MVARTRQPLIESTRRCALPAHQAEAAPRGAGLGHQDMATRAFWVTDDAAIERQRLAADLPADRQILDDAELRVPYANPLRWRCSTPAMGWCCGTASAAFTVTAAGPGPLSNQAVHIANNFANVPEQKLGFSADSQINLFAVLAFLKEGGQGNLSRGVNSFDLDFGDVAQGSAQEALLAFLNNNPPADQAFTDLLSSTGTIVPPPSPVFDITGDSVTRLPGGDTQSGFDISFDTSTLGSFMETLSFDVESINPDFDGFLSPVTFTIEGDVVSSTRPPSPAL